MYGQRRSVLVSGNACLATNVRCSDDGADRPAAHPTVGCMGAGKSLNLARLGMAVTLHTALGDDQPGRRVRERLARDGLRMIIDTDPAGTNTHVNLMHPDGGRTGVGIIAPSPVPPVDLDRLEPALRSADFIALNANGVCRPLLPLLRQDHRHRWCDLGDYRPSDEYFTAFADAATHVTMSGRHLPDPLPVLQRLIASGKQLAVVTDGARGSIAVTSAGRIVQTPALTDLPQVDTNGAGDSFFAGLLYGHAAGYPIEESLRLGSLVAAMTVASTELASSDLSPGRVEREHRRRFGDGQ
jgi:sugar/nucleoside kinase (ribokinase family)